MGLGCGALPYEVWVARGFLYWAKESCAFVNEVCLTDMRKDYE